MKRRSKNNFELNLDALTDVLTGLVGILLLVVILVSLNLGNVTMLNILKLWNHEGFAQNYRPMRFYLQDDAAFLINTPVINQGINDAVADRRITYDNLPAIVRDFNSANINDEFFRFSLYLREYSSGFTRRREPLLILDPNALMSSDSISQILDFITGLRTDSIKANSENGTYYIILTPDTSNIKQFRELRKVLFRENGIPFTWFPMRGKFSFPDTLSLTGGMGPPPPPPQ